MNGRIYDPQLGRFLSADISIPDSSHLQAYNRYSYVYNNPLRYEDPDGHVPVETVWDGGNVVLGTFETGAAIYTGDIVGAVMSGTGVVIDVGALLTPYVPGGASTLAKATNVARRMAKVTGKAADSAEAGLKSKLGGKTFKEAWALKHGKKAGNASEASSDLAQTAGKQADAPAPNVGKMEGEVPKTGSDGGKVATNKPVASGDKGTYGELKAQKKAHGETEPMDMDHRPSYAAQKKNLENQLGRELTPAEAKALKDNTPTVATPRKDHQQKSRTYGGRNTQTQIEADAADLEKARRLDEEAMR